jgi:hypothetical protein
VTSLTRRLPAPGTQPRTNFDGSYER